MKLVTAIIQPDRLDAVREALLAADITRITVSRCTGHGQHQTESEIYRGQTVIPNLIPKIRLDISCNDEFVKTACDAILNSARHSDGRIGDGKIFITDLLECIRIRTEETGPGAI